MSYWEEVDNFEEEKEMGSGRRAYLEERIRLTSSNRLEEALQKEIELEALADQYDTLPNGVVITWLQHFDKSKKKYTFVALRAANHWYTTSIFQNERMTTRELFDKHLQYAEEGVVLAATEWKKIL